MLDSAKPIVEDPAKTAPLVLLLVEDDDDHAELILDDVSRGPAEVSAVHVRSLTAAEDELTQRPVDAVLLDLGLPESRGLATLERFLAFGPTLPVLVMTSLEDVQVGLDAVRMGAQDFLSKSTITPVSLYRAITFGVERKRALTDIDRRRRMLEVFAASAGHDLTAPPRQIRDLAEMLREDTADKLGAVDLRRLDQIIGRAERMSTLLSDVLGFVRIGAATPMLELIKLNEAVLRVAEDLTEEEAGRVICETDLPFAADVSLLHLLLRNLITNGLKYWTDTPSTVTVRGAYSGASFRLTVADTGIGIPAEIHETVFLPGRRGVDQAAFPGTGYGLAICREVVSAHGGHIGLASEPGQGSTFDITLPLR